MTADRTRGQGIKSTIIHVWWLGIVSYNNICSYLISARATCCFILHKRIRSFFFFLSWSVSKEDVFHALHLFLFLLWNEIFCWDNKVWMKPKAEGYLFLFFLLFFCKSKSLSHLSTRQNKTNDILNFTLKPPENMHKWWTKSLSNWTIRSQPAMWFIFISALNKNNSNHPIGCSLSTSAWPCEAKQSSSPADGMPRKCFSLSL